MKIEGLDKLQRDLKQAQKALQDLPGEIELRFDPNDATSVETAIADMKLAVEGKVGRYRSNPFVAPLIDGMIEQFEQQILEKASEAMADTDKSIALDQQAFRGIENTVNDLRRADYRSFERHIKKLSRQLHGGEFDDISNELKSKVDLGAWLAAGERTQGGMVGSAQLDWPENHEEELGIVIALTDHFADENDGSWPPENFSHTFFYNGNNITSNLQHMVSEIYVPFARDFIDYVKQRTGAKEAALLPTRKLDPASRKVFVVHGHDEGAKEATARFLEALDFEPIILHEQASRGRTIVEKIEEHGDVGFAVVLLTPDDVGAHKDHSTDLKPRARQNVLLELGYFMGRLGRSRVVALKRGDVEVPSDFEGVVYVGYDSGNGWKQDLGKELDAAGYEIDWNKVMARR
ncbi:TIR domain-containing protein [Asticcacaulis solisilvae]|uniref:TIR domain-containing protein n=1 Tax=Asticcacaulis solisilvae TaxID=1217274 RepID=UPI003FD7C355